MGLFPSGSGLARATSKVARVMLGRGLRLFAAGLIGITGAGFVIQAGYATLRLAFGPELAALLTGLVLLGLAAGLVRAKPWPVRQAAAAEARAQAPPPEAPAQSGDPVTLAVFTLAYVLGRNFGSDRRP